MARVVRHIRRVGLVGRGLRAAPGLVRCATLFRNWPHLARLYAGVADFDPPVDAIGRRGFRLRLWEPPDVQTLWVVFCADSYHVGKSGRPRVVLDLGANIGAFTVLAACVLEAERVIALEPVTLTHECLTTNVALNALQDRVRALPLGIAGQTGTRTIHLGTATAHASLYFRGDPRYESGLEAQISVTTLDDLLPQLDASEIDLCKLDCEGAEYEALRAARDQTLRRMRRICMEYHPQPDWPHPEAVLMRLRDAGFRCIRHDPRHRLAVFDRIGGGP